VWEVVGKALSNYRANTGFVVKLKIDQQKSRKRLKFSKSLPIKERQGWLFQGSEAATHPKI
jgi:hypothetical protein